MSYSSPTPLPQGATKLSEIASDLAQALLDTAASESSLVVLQQLIGIIADGIRGTKYILHSSGDIIWTGTDILFNADAVANNIILTILQTEDSVTRTVNFILTGSLLPDTPTTFNDLPMANGDLLYLELDWAVIDPILAANSGNIPIQNAVSGGSVVPGMTLRTVNILTYTSGIPALMKSQSTGSTSFFIPLALRMDTVIGVTTYENIFWIPHGIRWPNGTASQLGAVLVNTSEDYAQYFITSQADLLTATSALSGAGGGLMLVVNPFEITQNITIPANCVLLGRSNGINTISVATGASLIMGNFAELRDLNIAGLTAFGASSTEYLVQMSGTRAFVRNTTFQLTNTAGDAVCIGFTGNYNRSIENMFLNMASSVVQTGLRYVSGDYNSDVDSYST